VDLSLPAAPRQRVLGAPPAAWVLTGGLAALAAGLSALTATLPGVDAPFVLPTWALVVLFAAAQRCLVHVQLWRESHSFSVSDVVLVLGLFFAAPATLPAAHVLGAALAMPLARNQRLSKCAFNLSLVGLETALAVLAFHLFSGLAAPGSAWTWLAAVPAMTVGVPLAAGAVFLAIRFSEGGLAPRHLVSILGLALAGTVTNTFIGLMGVRLLWHDPRDGWLVAVPTAMILLAYRAYVVQRRRREGLEFLYGASRLLQRQRDAARALLDVLGEALPVFHAAYAEVVLVPDDGGAPLRTRLHADGASSVLTPIADSDDAALVARLADAAKARRLDGLPADDAPLRGWLARRGLTTAMLAPLVGETRSMGVLLVGNRQGHAATFDAEELRLFEMLASHTGMVLANGQLEQSLVRMRSVTDELTYQAHHDALTGLANRTLFTHRLQAALERPTDEHVSVLFCDLDGFKAVNDSLGHDAGDELLKAVAERLRRCLRRHDTPARLGGDEFAVLIEADVDERALAERIVAALGAPFALAAGEARIGVSIGVASGRPRMLDVAELLRLADAAMYDAKRAGKGRVVVAGAGGPPVALAR
jgi:diguanylate cyclase (GGDEF)-like protein